MARIFLSHSSRDNEPAQKIKDWLQASGFGHVFLDFDKHKGIKPGSNWERALYEQLERCQAVLLILTPNWMDSKWCFAEFTQARALGKAIFPLILSPLGEQLVASDIQQIDITKEGDGGFERLAESLTQVAMDAQGGFELPKDRPPFPGLAAFQKEDAAIYFGRDDDIRKLIERLNARRAQGGAKMVTLLGASGSGKSSLLRAGLIPRLEKDKNNWIVLPPFRPQLRPVDSFAQVLAGELTSQENWRLRLMREDIKELLPDIAFELRAKHNTNEAQILFSIDQGEELFSTAEPDQQQRFIALMAGMMHPDMPFLLLYAMRSDYLGLLQKATIFTDRYEAYPLSPMPLARIPQIISGPAKVVGLLVEEALVQRALQDAETADALPLLAFALRELYDRFGQDGDLKLTEYLQLGDAEFQKDHGKGLNPLENAIRQRADDVLEEAKPSEEELLALRQAFVPDMVRVNEEGDYVRQPAKLNKLPAAAHTLLTKLADARLLTIRKDEKSGENLIEVAHEALLRKWPRLRAWLDEAREFLIGKQQLERSLIDWQNVKEDDHKNPALLRGLQLNRARQWLIEHPHQLKEAERKFIQQSDAFEKEELEKQEAIRHTAERRRVMLLRGATIAAVILLIVAGFAGWQWYEAQEQTKIARTERDEAGRQRDIAKTAKRSADEQREQAQTTQSQLWAGFAKKAIAGREYATAISLALAALPDETLDPKGNQLDDRPHLPKAEQALFKALSIDRKLFESTNKELVIGPDNRRVIFFNENVTYFDVTDATTGRVLYQLSCRGTVPQKITFSADGKWIAAYCAYDSEEKIRIWDATSGKLLQILVGAKGFQFYPRTPNLLKAEYRDKAVVINVATGQKISTFKQDALIPDLAPSHGRKIIKKNGGIKIIDTNTGKLIKKIDRPDKATSFGIEDCYINDDGNYLIYTFSEATEPFNSRPVVVLVNLESGKQITRFNSANLSKSVFTRDNSAFLMKDKMGIRIINLATGTNFHVFKTPGSETTYTVSPDGKRLAIGDKTGWVRIFELSTYTKIDEFRSGENELDMEKLKIRELNFSPDGNTIYVQQDKWFAWSLSLPLRHSLPQSSLEHINGLGVTPDGIRVVGTTKAGAVQILDPIKGRSFDTGIRVEKKKVLEKGKNKLKVKFSPDGRTLTIYKEGERSAQLWNAVTGTQLANLEGHTQKIAHIEFDANRRRLLTTSYDKTIQIWNTQTGELLTVLRGHEREVLGGAFAPNQDHIATISRDGTVRLWNASNGSEIKKVRGHGTENKEISDILGFEEIRSARDTDYSIDYLPDGRLVTKAGDWVVRIWNFASEDYGPLPGYGDARHVLISPDGSRLIIIAAKEIRFFDSKNMRKIATLNNSLGFKGAIFDPSGRRVLIIQSNGEIQVLDLLGGVEAYKISGKQALHAAFTKTGDRLLVSSLGGRLISWKYFSSTQELVDYGKRHTKTCLSSLSADNKYLLPLTPPRWCITGPGNEAKTDPTEWEPLSQFVWKEFLAARDRGERIENPTTRFVEIARQVTYAAELFRRDKYSRSIEVANKAIALGKGRFFTNEQMTAAYRIRGAAHYKMGNLLNGYKDFVSVIKYFRQGSTGGQFDTLGVSKELLRSLEASKDKENKIRPETEVILNIQEVLFENDLAVEFEPIAEQLFDEKVSLIDKFKLFFSNLPRAPVPDDYKNFSLLAQFGQLRLNLDDKEHNELAVIMFSSLIKWYEGATVNNDNVYEALASSYYQRAWLYDKSGEFEKRNSDLILITQNRKNPEFALQFFIEKAQEAAGLEQLDKAFAAIQEAFDWQKKYGASNEGKALLISKRGDLYDKSGNRKARDADYLTAYALMKDTEATRFGLIFSSSLKKNGDKALHANRFELAISEYSKAISWAKRSGVKKDALKWALFARGKAYDQTENEAARDSDFKEAYKLGADVASYFDNKGETAFKSGLPEKSVKALSLAIKYDPKRPPGKYEYRLARAHNIIARNAFNAVALRDAPIATLGPALEHADKAVGLQPKDAKFLDTRAQILFKLKKIEEAFSDFDKAIKSGEGAAIAYYGRARIHEHRGNKLAALTDYRNAYEMGAGNSEYAEHVLPHAKKRFIELEREIRSYTPTEQSLFLSDQVQTYLERKDYPTAILLALAGLPDKEAGVNRPYLQKVERSLQMGLRANLEGFALYGHETEITGLAFSPDGQRALTTSEDTTARLWDVGTGKTLLVLRGHEGAVRHGSFSPDGRLILTASADHTVRVWESGNGKQITVFKGFKIDFTGAIFSPEGQHILTTSRDGIIRIWDSYSGEQIKEIKGVKRNILSIAYSPDSSKILVSSWESKEDHSEDYSTQLFETSFGKKLFVFNGHRDKVNSVKFSLDGKRILTASGDETARLWDTESGRQLNVFEGHTQSVETAVFSPDGKHILTVSRDDTARLWNAATGKLITILEGHANEKYGEIYGAAFSLDGKRILTRSSETARIWDAESGQEFAELKDYKTEWTKEAVLSPDGTKVLTRSSNNNFAQLWNLAGGQMIPKLVGQALVNRAKHSVSRCLDQTQLKDFYLPTAPQRWCITGSEFEREKNPSKWQPKWPYHTKVWRDWLIARDKGENPPLPKTEK